MSNLYIITGPAGVGKSTISRRIAESKNKLKNHTIKFVVLVVDEKTLLLRDKERPEDCQMKERCIVLLNSFKNKNYNAQNILDTTNLSVNETIDIIENDNRFIL